MMVLCLWHMDLWVIKIWRALKNSEARKQADITRLMNPLARDPRHWPHEAEERKAAEVKEFRKQTDKSRQKSVPCSNAPDRTRWHGEGDMSTH